MEPRYLTVQGRGTLALPPDVRKRLHLDKPGAQVAFIEREDGVIELHPQISVPADQAWFWSARWQEMEREAQAEIDAGEVKTFDSAEAFLADLTDGAES